jgi:hypothetical protein
MIRLLIALGVLASTTAWAIGADLALVCFARGYDRAHLARHPDQLVKNVKLHIVKSPTRKPPFAHDFALRMRVRGRDEPLSTVGLCRADPPGVDCFVECDGGSLRVVPHANLQAYLPVTWVWKLIKLKGRETLMWVNKEEPVNMMITQRVR